MRRNVQRMLSTLLLVGCGGGDGFVTSPGTIVFVSGASTVEKGGRLTLGVALTGRPTPTLRGCTSSDPGVLLASVAGTECAITGVDVGSASVTATSSSDQVVSRTISVTGLAALNGRPALRAPAAMFVTDTGTVNVSLTPADASVSVATTYTTLTPGLLTVSANGALTAVAPGTASVRVVVSATGPRHARSVDTLQATIAIAAQQPGLTSVRLTLPGDTALTIGVVKTLQATVQGPLNATARLTFGSVTPTIATVDTAGRATGVATGTARLWVRAQSASNGPFAGSTVSDTLTVRVAALLPPFQDVVLPALPDLFIGQQVSLAPTIVPTPGTALTPTLVTTFGAVSNPSVVTLSASGLVTAVSPGTVTIPVIVRGSGPGFRDTTVTRTATIRVLPQTPGLTGLTVAPTSVALTIGGTATLVATAAGPRAANATVTYTTNAPAIATVSASGIVTAVGQGSAVVTVTATSANAGQFAASSVSALVPVTVSGSITAIRLSAAANRVRTLATLPITVTATATPGVNTAVTWRSRSPTVATVATDGVVSGVTEGSAWIVAKAVADSTIADSLNIRVLTPCNDTPDIAFGTTTTATFSSRSCLDDNKLRERFRITLATTTMLRTVLQSSTLPVSLTPLYSPATPGSWESPQYTPGDYLTAIAPAGDFMVGVNSTLQPNTASIVVERGFADTCDPVIIPSGVTYTLRLFTSECATRSVFGINAYVRNLYLLPSINTGQVLRVRGTSTQFRVHIDLYNSATGNLVDSVTAPAIGLQAEAVVTAPAIGQYYYAVLSNRQSPTVSGGVTVTIIGPPYLPAPSAPRVDGPARVAPMHVSPARTVPALHPSATRRRPPN